MPHHQTPLVKNLESKGQDDDAQEAHQEVAGAIQAGTLQHLEACVLFCAFFFFVEFFVWDSFCCMLFVAFFLLHAFVAFCLLHSVC